MRTYLGILLLALAFFYGLGLIYTFEYNAGMKSYVPKVKKAYATATDSYKSESNRIATAISQVNDTEKYPSLEDRMNALTVIFRNNKPDMKKIAETDKELVDQLWHDFPYHKRVPIVGFLYPPYKKSVEDYEKMRDLLHTADRHVAAEQFIADESQNYFPKIAKFQAYLQARAVFELSEVFTSALPADEGREKRLKDIAIKKYSRSVERHIPGTIKIVHSIPMPDHPYYKQKRQEALDMLKQSQTMYELYLKAETEGDKIALQKADAMAKNNPELKDYVNRAAGIMLSAFVDIGALDTDVKQLIAIAEKS